jgi:cytochrome P450
MTDDRRLPAMPFARSSVLDVAPLYRALQGERPVTLVRTPVGDLAWLVPGYEDVRALLEDERLGRSHPDPERAPRFSGSAFILGGPTGTPETERADSARTRRVLARSFAPDRLHAMRPRVQALVDELLDGVAGGTPPADLHAELSLPLPVMVICEFLGVPAGDRPLFRTWAEESADLRDRQRATAAFGALREYMGGLIERKRERPAADLISDLVAARDEGGPLGDPEIARLATSLLLVGHESTVARIDFGILYLLVNPDQVRALAGDPSLLAGAIEEILRIAVPGEGVVPRYASADIEVGGVTVRAGDLVLLGIGPANRDRGVYPDPDRFDIARRQAPHIAFGHGAHRCLGAGLARIELQAVFGTLFRRLPTLRLALPVERLPRRSHAAPGGLAALPVTW